MGGWVKPWTNQTFSAELVGSANMNDYFFSFSPTLTKVHHAIAPSSHWNGTKITLQQLEKVAGNLEEGRLHGPHAKAQTSRTRVSE